MRTILQLLAAFIIAMNGPSQNAVNEKKVLAAHMGGVVRKKGIANGSATASKLIGPEGGEISDDDGKISVKIPPGALSNDVTISIQPITSTLPLTAGTGGFRLLPEGQHFQKPVTITFKYSDDDINGSAPGALHIAYQDGKSVWKAINASQLDALKKTVSVQSTHFSDWSMFKEYAIKVYHNPLSPGQTTGLDVSNIDLTPGNGGESAVGDSSIKLEPLANKGKFQNWKLLGAGKLSADGVSADYTAPSVTPSRNPVEVSVEVVNIPGTKVKLILIAYITIHDMFMEITIKGKKYIIPICLGYEDHNHITVMATDPSEHLTVGVMLSTAKPGSYEFGDGKIPGSSGVGVLLGQQGYDSHDLDCTPSVPTFTYRSGTVTLDSIGKLGGFITGSFKGLIGIPDCDKHESFGVEGRFIAHIQIKGQKVLVHKNVYYPGKK